MKFIISFILMFPLVAFSQEKATFSIGFENESIIKALVIIENTYNVRFSYQNSAVENTSITLVKAPRDLTTILDDIAQKTQLIFKIVDDRYIVVTKNTNDFARVELLDNVVIHGYLSKGISKNKDATFSIDPKALEILPGLIEPDVLESLQQLPGVISPNETASGITVRGGRSDQNRLIWDGINMYHKGHLFGMISAFNPNSVHKVTFVNKGTHPRYGERTSSVIDIESNSEVPNAIKAEMGFNAISSDVVLAVPILKDKLSVQGSLRRSFTEVYQSYTFDQMADKVFQSTKILDDENTNNDFNFLDYNLRINFKPNANNSFYLSTIGIDNQLDHLSRSSEDNTSFNDILKIENSGYGFGWTTDWNTTLSQRTQAYFSKYELAYNYITIEDDEQISDFDKRNIIFDSGISSELSYQMNENNTMTFGYQYALKDVSYAFVNRADLSFVLDSDDRVVETHSVYGNYDIKSSKWFDVNVGLRANYFESLNALRLEPRLMVYKSLFDNFKIHLTGEIKNQIISEIDETILSDLSLENKLWRLADGETFPIINGKQFSVGFIYAHNGWSVDIDHYYKHLNNVTALSLGFLNPEDNDFHIGKQKTIGVDVLVKKDLKNLKTWIGYSFNDVQSKYDGINDNSYFASNTHIRHAFTTSITYKKDKLQMALGWKWRSGKPYTASINTDGNITFDSVNTERLSNYHRLDFSSTYNFNVSKRNDIQGKIGFSIRNVYNRKNQISREYEGNNTLNDPIEVVDKFSIGFTPNVLFRVYWK